MITVTLPLMKLWFWLLVTGGLVAGFIVTAFILDALTLRKRLIQNMDNWQKQKEHFK
jgi:multisubunit Na+/H+ antiporter MnhE subunit